MTEVRDAMIDMRDLGRVVRIDRERGHLLIEAKTRRDNGRELVSHYVVRWRGDGILPSYWREDDPLKIRNELAKAEKIETLRKDDVDLEL